jgi:hypothetical protein
MILIWRRMLVVSASHGKFLRPQICQAAQELIFSSNIKGKPSHKIVSDGMPLYVFLEIR